MKRLLIRSAFLTILLAAVIGSACSGPKSGQVQSRANSAYQRIIESGTIRVGYVPVAVGLDVDPNTGKVSGIFADVLQEMAKNMGLKVEFAEEVGWGTMIAGMQTGRYDMMASPVWPNSTRAKHATFSKPVYFSAIGVWVRQNENRFSSDASWASLNDPQVRIAAIDGSTGATIAQTQFPQAKLVSYPELTAEGQVFLDLNAGRADVFFEEPAKGLLYIKNNPGQVKNIATTQPVKVFPNIFMLPAEEYRLKEMIDTALEEVQNSGFVDRVLAKYEPAPQSYYRVAVPYRIFQ